MQLHSTLQTHLARQMEGSYGVQLGSHAFEGRGTLQCLSRSNRQSTAILHFELGPRILSVSMIEDLHFVPSRHVLHPARRYHGSQHGLNKSRKYTTVSGIELDQCRTKREIYTLQCACTPLHSEPLCRGVPLPRCFIAGSNAPA